MGEDGGGREGHLERMRGERRHEGRLARRRAVDGSQPTDDLVHGQLDRPAGVVPERHDVVGAEALHGVIERVEEHPPAELAVCHHIEPARDLALDGLTDRLVLELGQRAAIPRPLLVEHRGVPRGVEPLHGAAQPGGTQQASDHLGAGWMP
jgi:hypothetical protein